MWQPGCSRVSWSRIWGWVSRRRHGGETYLLAEELDISLLLPTKLKKVMWTCIVRINFILKWQLATGEKGTVLKFDSNDMIGSERSWKHLIGLTEWVNAHSQLTELKAGKRARVDVWRNEEHKDSLTDWPSAELHKQIEIVCFQCVSSFLLSSLECQLNCWIGVTLCIGYVLWSFAHWKASFPQVNWFYEALCHKDFISLLIWDLK